MPAAVPAAAQPKWGSFVSDEDEEECSHAVQHPPSKASPPAQLQCPQPAHGQWQQRQQPQLTTPGIGTSTSRLGENELALPPGGGLRPIVRPPQVAQQGWQPQRAPLQPTSQLHPQSQQLPASGWKQPAAALPAMPAAGGGGTARQPAPQQPVHAPPGAPASSGWNCLVGGVVQLGWPTAEECARPARRVAVPASFGSAQQYVQVWSNALLEELNLRWVGAALLGALRGGCCTLTAAAASGLWCFNLVVALAGWA